MQNTDLEKTAGSFEDMTTLSSVINSSIKKGYAENFQAKPDGLYSPTTGIYYLPNEVKIDNFYRFEGASDPQDNAILYLLETHDGIKGMLIDGYGAGVDALISEFIRKIDEIQKAKKTEA